MRVNILATVFVLLASVGCGTLSGSKQVVSVTSEPTDADIVKGGEVVGTTPGNIVLDTNDPNDYSFVVKKEGYGSKEVSLSTSTDPSIIFGNLLIGGVPI